jgi:catechol 2,3-dioxygenase
MTDHFTISPATRCGTVALIVADLARSLRYYTERIGLHVHRQEPGAAWLGAGGEDLLHLIEQPGARPVQRGRTGLYHFAILTPSRADLGRTLQHLVATETLIDGASDHGVSEALYLTDPDGHGIEIYRDRPSAEWPRLGGDLRMTLDPLDFRGVAAAAGGNGTPYTGMHSATVIGHVHLHVPEIRAAEAFYVDALGLELMQRFHGQASFVAAGGYHHHLGLNVWAGIGAPPPPTDAARLAWYELVLPDADALQAAVAHLAASGFPATPDGPRWRVLDPARNTLVLRCAA